MLLLRLAIWACALLSLRGSRWAYAAFAALTFLYFPARVGFHIQPRACETAMSLPLALLSLQNYPHMAMFGVIFVVTTAQFRMGRWSGYGYAALLTLGMGAIVEIGEGISGTGHCRLRDLVPDSVGALMGAAVVWAWHRVRRRLST